MDFENTTANERFHERQRAYARKDMPIWMHHAWWVLHNCVAHPLIGVLPSRRTFDFHDFTSRKLNAFAGEEDQQ